METVRLLVADGKPYRLRPGDRINYSVTARTLQVFTNGPHEIEFEGFPDASVTTPRIQLKQSLGIEELLELLGALARSHGLEGNIEQVENSHPSHFTFLVAN